MLYYLLFLVPVASALLFPGEKCGGYICLNSTLHEVNCKDGVCNCNEGYYGNGRFQCVKKSTACVCYLYGDPHVTAFSEAVIKIPLPCRHILSEFITPTGVSVKVAALGVESSEGIPGLIYEEQIYFDASKGTTTAHANIRRSGFYNKGLHIPLPVRENFPDIGLTVYGENESHYWRLELPRHKVIVRYRSADSSLTIQTPRGSTFSGDRPCGNCDDPPDAFVRASIAQRLSLNELSFYKTVLSLDFDKEQNPTCKALSSAATSCPETKLQNALQFCGAPYADKEIGKCFVLAYGKEEVLAKTAECVNTFCQSTITDLCTEVTGVLAACSYRSEKENIIDKMCQPGQ
ncbi:hypothetical protein LOTGIDRAFT_232647 [Lottia gigantea]|uniref:Uncharacterized protein n=1 Tax=Lottia gigantea TaxID=225164 RepID=V3ZQD5_LOTGI|nr:hypothetical protein LOTGIDRAFT_232647 [Lottia gigantea]ESO93608.1 hypothetical protein LOTGIDRAFT_232647 [Lottia gigantea]